MYGTTVSVSCVKHAYFCVREAGGVLLNKQAASHILTYISEVLLESPFESILTFYQLFFLSTQEGVKTENNEHINLKVAGQDGSVVQFKIKRHTPLSKLMKAYCERQVGLQHS